MKIALGTVQFGLDYGIANQGGKVPFDEVNKILDLAKKNDITYLDTAMGYGLSESVLGQYKQQNNDNCFNIITKLPDITKNGDTIKNLLDESLVRLSCHQIYGLLCHIPATLNHNTFEKLSLLKEQRVIKKLGVSVYSPEQAFYIAENFNIDLIQLPLNIFDQRFIDSGCLAHLKDRGIEIHSRSLFLQGLLLQPLSEIHEYFRPYFTKINLFHDFCLQNELSTLDVAVSLIHNVKSIDKFVIGVCSEQQLEEILKSYRKTVDIKLESKMFSTTEEKFINPALWNIKNK